MKIAVLFQSQPPPEKNGIKKPMKVGGYSDSGADIGYCLKRNGIELITPIQKPNPLNDIDWVFPDTVNGIREAISKGARVLWLNTVIFKGHPIEFFFKKEIEIIGQFPEMVDKYDDKIETNKILSKNNLLIPKNKIIRDIRDLDTINKAFQFPIVAKPIRGRGSQGVIVGKNMEELRKGVKKILDSGNFGDYIYIEQFLSGKEITITVMPPGKYVISQDETIKHKYWSLAPVERFNHINGIAPYNGTIAVINNSKVISDKEIRTKNIKSVMSQCEKAAKIISAKAPIRIDCRADENGEFHLFDINMKPNMTGASREHRLNQDSLTMIAARKLGWNYFDLLKNIINQKWKPLNN